MTHPYAFYVQGKSSVFYLSCAGDVSTYGKYEIMVFKCTDGNDTGDELEVKYFEDINDARFYMYRLVEKYENM